MEPAKATSQSYEAKALATEREFIQSLRDTARLHYASAESSACPDWPSAQRARDSARACEDEASKRERALQSSLRYLTALACKLRAESLREDCAKLEALATKAEEPTAKSYGRACEALKAEAEACEIRARALRDDSEAVALAIASAQPARKIVRALEVGSYGLDHSQYFRGAGAEGYEDVSLGCGGSEAEALEDALESLASSGNWQFKPELGFPAEPSAADFSDEDEKSAAEAEALESELPQVEPTYSLRFCAHNGIAWYLTEDCESEAEARAIAMEYLERMRSEDGFEVTELDGSGDTATAWESHNPQSGVSDEEGTLRLFVSNTSAIEKREDERERYCEEGSELWYYVAVRVSQAPEGSERGAKRYDLQDEDGQAGAIEYEAEDGTEWLYCESYEVAQACALSAARESLWAFDLYWASKYFPESLQDSEAIEALKTAQAKLCESFGPIMRALLGSREDEALRTALGLDGFAHFLAHYDGAELRDEDGAYRYRTA